MNKSVVAGGIWLSMRRSLLLFALQKESREVEQDMDEESRRWLGGYDWCMIDGPSRFAFKIY